MKAQGRGPLPPTSQVLVEHPEAFVKHIKQCLSSKEGIPVKQQRLVFSGPGAQALEESQGTSKQQPAVEEILSSLSQWQAIIFENGRAIGRSVNLKLYSCKLPESSLYESEDSLAIECFALQLDAWHPSWKARTEDSSPLYIAVDEDFKRSSFHVQLIGRTSRGTNFALPFAYKFEGSAVCSRLDYYDQHVRRHQQSFASLHDTEISGEYNIKFGEGLQSFTAVLDVVDQPHWLKSLILRFSVLVASTLDDQAESCVSRAALPQHLTASSMAAPEQPSGSLALSPAGSLEERRVAQSASTCLDCATDQGWLPPTLLPPKSEQSGKQKLSKKRSKQRFKPDMQHAQSAEKEQPMKSHSKDIPESTPAHKPDWDLSHAECLEETTPNGKAFSDDSAEDHTCRMEGTFIEPASEQPSSEGPSHDTEKDTSSAAGPGVKNGPQPASTTRTGPDTAVRWRPSHPTGIKIRAGQGTTAPMHPAPAPQKYVHPNAARSARNGFPEELLPPAGRRGNAWRGGHSSVSSLVVDAAGGDESSSWQSLSEDSDRSASSDVGMTSPVSVGRSEGLRKASGAPSPGEPPRAIVGSPGRVSSQSCAPPLDQLLPGHACPAAFKAPLSAQPDAPAAPEHAVGDSDAGKAASGKSSASQASAKAAAPFRVLSMNSDRSQAAQSIAKAAEAGQPPAASKAQQGSVAQAETSVKAAPKQPAPVRTGAQRPGVASLQPPVRMRSPQKRSAPPVASPFTTHAPSHAATPAPARPHAQQQRSAHMHVPSSTGHPGMDAQLLTALQHQLSVSQGMLEAAGALGSARAPMRSQSLPRMQQEPLKQQQGHRQPMQAMSDAQRPTIMQHMLPQGLPSYGRQSPQLPVMAKQLLPKQAPAHASSTRGQRSGPALDAHVPRRHSVPASPVMAAHSGPFGFHPHSEALPMQQFMQQALSANGFAGQAQPARGTHMQGQSMGYPAVRQKPAPYVEPSLQHAANGPVSRSLAPQAPQPSDVERFISLTTPMLPGKGHGLPKLAHLWSFYEEASVFGKEVHTTGGSRGSSRAFFVPSLSAMQLFVPADGSAQLSGSVCALSDAAAAQHPSWPKRMRLLKEVFEAAKPYERPPLTQRIEQLAAEPCMDSQPGSLLKDLPLQQLHPASWICVAWYPVYRIPDAPLTAKFLTYHSLVPVACSATHYGALCPPPARSAPSWQASGPLCLPAIGLKCISLGCGSWLDAVPGLHDGSPGVLPRMPSIGSSSEDGSSIIASSEDLSSCGKNSTLGIGSLSPAWEGPQNRRARLMELGMCADRLSWREVQVGSRGQQQHDDHSFFCRHADMGVGAR